MTVMSMLVGLWDGVLGLYTAGLYAYDGDGDACWDGCELVSQTDTIFLCFSQLTIILHWM